MRRVLFPQEHFSQATSRKAALKAVRASLGIIRFEPVSHRVVPTGGVRSAQQSPCSASDLAKVWETALAPLALCRLYPPYLSQPNHPASLEHTLRVGMVFPLDVFPFMSWVQHNLWCRNTTTTMEHRCYTATRLRFLLYFIFMSIKEFVGGFLGNFSISSVGNPTSPAECEIN